MTIKEIVDKVYYNPPKHKYYTAKHSGGLKECLETEEPITKETADLLIESKLYKFYAYDKRINADRYLIVDIEHNLGLPQWIHIYKN